MDWLVSRRPAAKEAANGPGGAHERLLGVCRLLVLEPWAEMVGAPMGSWCSGPGPSVATPGRGQPLRPHRRYPSAPAGPDPQQGSCGQHQLRGGKIAMPT
ncbi:uncharacterized protein SOCE836_067520 [Sorangium cellulosum]|uniref:Uncharacterized protein n=1 Tax=Sorangium cellulosum TaxID=56 RepID=A0A4P2QWI5_SORCE|nr:uncharacterized protein SOCE836_067520 [Sorangium cellulosum]